MKKEVFIVKLNNADKMVKLLDKAKQQLLELKETLKEIDEFEFN